MTEKSEKVEVPCQFCGGNLAKPDGRHKFWCPVINPVEPKDG